MNQWVNFDLSTSLRLFSFTALSPVSDILEHFETEFLRDVYAKHGLVKLKHHKVIPDLVKKDIESADDEDAKYILFEHLQKHATLKTLRAYCDVAFAADGYPRMQALAKRMKRALSAARG